MANLKFNVKVYLENAGVLPELKARMADMSPAFEAIFLRFAELNEQKFELAKGGEIGGADIFGEFWKGLSSGYLKEKHPSGAPKRKKASGEYPDWLMVRTGALKDAMSDPEALFKYVAPDSATFGTPNDPDLADIVRWQANPERQGRQVIFLSEPDMNGIRKVIQDYLGMGGDFQAMRFAAGLQAQNLESEIEAMDAEFASEMYE